MAKPRLFVDIPLKSGAEIELEKGAQHYLCHVLRLRVGDRLEIFNGQDGSFEAELSFVNRNEAEVSLLAQSASLILPPDIELAFAPIKKGRSDFIVEKASEIGVRAIRQVITEFTNCASVKSDRLLRRAIEATEQSRGNYVPQISEAVTFDEFLKGFDEAKAGANATKGRALIFCNEGAKPGDGLKALEHERLASATILIGPEGGFSPSEHEALIGAGALSLSLGSRILRAETAAIAALTLWMQAQGGWGG